MVKSPYISNDQRLADVIAAIQAMSTYRFYKLDFAGWSDRITGDENKALHWKTVFKEHPEFFRLDSRQEKASLVIRRQHRKRYEVDKGKTISDEEFANHPNPSRISRSPLSTEEISSLIQTAIEMHSRAIAQQQYKMSWVPVFSVIASFIGAIFGAYIVSSGGA